MKRKRIQVLVVDDSRLFVDVISRIIERDSEMSIAGIANTGREAVDSAEQLRPDIILMDVQMPVMDGLRAIEIIMAENPTPILVLSGDSRYKGAELSFEAVKRGALDVRVKPTSANPDSTESQDLRDLIKFLSGVPVVRHIGRGDRSEIGEPGRALSLANLNAVPPRAIGIATSTGGPEALASILSALPASFPCAIAVVQHLSGGLTESFARWLDSVSHLKVRLSASGGPLEPGTVSIAPEDRHMSVGADCTIELAGTPPVERCRPSGTVLLHSMARTLGASSVGLVLTGMGRDGADGLLAIQRAGGVTIAQDEESSVVYGMPKAARDLNAAQHILSLDDIPGALCDLARVSRGSAGRSSIRRAAG